jgi:hypothetical protein
LYLTCFYVDLGLAVLSLDEVKSVLAITATFPTLVALLLLDGLVVVWLAGFCYVG